MTVEHSNITDPYIHLPKGFAAASPSQYLRKNAGGTDVEWVTHNVGYGCLYMTSSAATTGITGTFLPINDAALGGTLVWTEQVADNMVSNITDGYWEAAEAGTYMIGISISLSGAVAASNEFQFTVGIDSSPYGAIVEKSAVVSSYRTVTTTEKGSVSLTCMPTLAATDRLYLMIRRNSGTNQAIFQHINFVINKASQ